MKFVFIFALMAVLAPQPAPRFERLAFTMPKGAAVTYGLAVPADYDRRQPRPLVLALHPGGRAPYYGDSVMRNLYFPGLSDLAPIMVAPDVPSASWTDPESEQAVIALLDQIAGDYTVDRRRVLVIGFSAGARGTWFLSSRHADLFTSAIVVAGRTDEPVEQLGKMPTYIIHSRADEQVPFEQAERRASALERLGRPVKFEALSTAGHYDMGSYLDSIRRAGSWIKERWER